LRIFSAMFVVAAIISYLEGGLARLEGPDILFSLGLVGGTTWQSARYFRARQVYNSLVTDHAAGWVLAWNQQAVLLSDRKYYLLPV